MSAQIHCDYCGRPLSGEYRAGTATLRLDADLDARVANPEWGGSGWQRHFCTDGGRESCAHRALAALDQAAERNRADLGLEWRLVPTEERS